jgi:hypothetical protein
MRSVIAPALAGVSRKSVYGSTTAGGRPMTTAFPATTLTRRPGGRTFRTTWVLRYQDALGNPDDEVLERRFTSEAAALAWADGTFVVPLDLEEHESMFDGDGHLMGTTITHHEV